MTKIIIQNCSLQFHSGHWSKLMAIRRQGYTAAFLGLLFDICQYYMHWFYPFVSRYEIYRVKREDRLAETNDVQVVFTEGNEKLFK